MIYYLMLCYLLAVMFLFADMDLHNSHWTDMVSGVIFLTLLLPVILIAGAVGRFNGSARR